MKRFILMMLLVTFTGAIFPAHVGAATNVAPDQSGRNTFITGTTMLALGYWGPSVPMTFGIEDEIRAVGVGLLTAGAGFFIPYFATQNSRLTKGMANFSLIGGIKGIIDGTLLHNLITGGIDNVSEESQYGTMLVTSIAELYGFYKIAEKYNYSAGKANLLGSISMFGTLYGFLALNTLDSSTSIRANSAVMLGGSILGYVAGNYLFNPEEYGEGDYVMPTLCGSLGGLLPLTFFSGIDRMPDESVVSGITLIASVLGLWAGDQLVEGIDMSNSQGNYTSLGTLGGALAVVGLVFALGGDSDAILRWLPMGAVLGGAGGMLLVYSTFKQKILRQKKSAFQLMVNPAALAFGLNEKSFSSSSVIMQQPGITVNLSF